MKSANGQQNSAKKAEKYYFMLELRNKTLEHEVLLRLYLQMKHTSYICALLPHRVNLVAMTMCGVSLLVVSGGGHGQWVTN